MQLNNRTDILAKSAKDDFKADLLDADLLKQFNPFMRAFLKTYVDDKILNVLIQREKKAYKKAYRNRQTTGHLTSQERLDIRAKHAYLKQYLTHPMAIVSCFVGMPSSLLLIPDEPEQANGARNINVPADKIILLTVLGLLAAIIKLPLNIVRLATEFLPEVLISLMDKVIDKINEKIDTMQTPTVFKPTFLDQPLLASIFLSAQFFKYFIFTPLKFVTRALTSPFKNVAHVDLRIIRKYLDSLRYDHFHARTSDKIALFIKKNVLPLVESFLKGLSATISLTAYILAAPFAITFGLPYLISIAPAATANVGAAIVNFTAPIAANIATQLATNAPVFLSLVGALGVTAYSALIEVKDGVSKLAAKIKNAYKQLKSAPNSKGQEQNSNNNQLSVTLTPYPIERQEENSNGQSSIITPAQTPKKQVTQKPYKRPVVEGFDNNDFSSLPQFSKFAVQTTTPAYTEKQQESPTLGMGNGSSNSN